jgi:hypothetical protein
VFRAMLAALGLSAANDYDMNRCVCPTTRVSLVFCACFGVRCCSLASTVRSHATQPLVPPTYSPMHAPTHLTPASLAVPRKAKEAIGAITRLEATDGSGRAMTVNGLVVVCDARDRHTRLR